jgi:hypothetical protein
VHADREGKPWFTHGISPCATASGAFLREAGQGTMDQLSGTA